MRITSGSDLKGPKYIPCIREGEQRAHFIMLLDDHPADSQGWTLARESTFCHMSTQILIWQRVLQYWGPLRQIIMDEWMDGWMDGWSVAICDRDMATNRPSLT